METKKSIVVIVLTTFLLLAVLFGIQIMAFIFSSFSPSFDYDNVAAAVVNESGGWVNASGYPVDAASDVNFDGGVTVSEIWGNISYSTAYLIPAANYSVDATTGIIVNATGITNASAYDNVNVSYAWSTKTEAELTANSVNNNSLNALDTYSEGASDQMSIILIVITLVLLLAVFALFWKMFIKNGSQKSSGGADFGYKGA